MMGFRTLVLRFLIFVLAIGTVPDAKSGLHFHGTNPSSYEGFVATGGRITDTRSFSFNQAMSRSQHKATEALTSIKLVLPNFYTALPDAGVGNAATVSIH